MACWFQCWKNSTGFVFDRSKTLVLLMWKWMGLLLRKNHLLRCWDWLSFLNLNGALTLSPLLKPPPRKLQPWFVLWSFFLLRLLYISINLPYAHAWNTLAMFGLVLLCYLELLDKLQKLNIKDCWSFTCCISWTLGSSSYCSQLKSFL